MCMKQWNIDQNTPEPTHMPDFILIEKDARGFKSNFIMYLVNCFFDESKNHYYSKSILKYMKDVNQIASLDWCQFILDKLIISVKYYKEKGYRRGGFQWSTILLDGEFFYSTSNPFIK